MSHILDVAGLTDAQLGRLGLAIGGLLAGGADRDTALEEVVSLRAEQTRTSTVADDAPTVAERAARLGARLSELEAVLNSLAAVLRNWHARLRVIASQPEGTE